MLKLTSIAIFTTLNGNSFIYNKNQYPNIQIKTPTPLAEYTNNKLTIKIGRKIITLTPRKNTYQQAA